MRDARRQAYFLVAGLLVIVGLPLAGNWARCQSETRCAFDGLKIEPLYRVRIVDRESAARCFCCTRCARLWLTRRAEQPRSIYVTDEADGTEIDSRSAFFVQSPVVTNAITANRVHAFRDRVDAEAHVRAFGGMRMGAGELFQYQGGEHE